MKLTLENHTRLFFIFILLFLYSDSHSTTYNVNVMNFSFSSPNINVLVGDTIKWQYISGSHTTTCNGSFGTSRPAGAPAWDNPINVSMPQFKYVVTVAGAYTYKCAIHSSMTAMFTATNPVLNLNLTSMLEGFWNGTVMVSDTVKVFLRNSTSPYGKVDSAKIKLSSSGTGSLTFNNAAAGSYYIDVTHRNSIETWSKLPVVFVSGGTANYDFTTAADKAFGNNQILKDGKFTFYSGDVNQDGSINLADVILIHNSTTSFETGYIVTDVNGDNVADLADILIAHNNSISFITVSMPS